jgi:hypothetical protein
MMPKSAKRFSDNIMLQTIRNDHVYDLGSVRSKIIVISPPRPTQTAEFLVSNMAIGNETGREFGALVNAMRHKTDPEGSVRNREARTAGRHACTVP